MLHPQICADPKLLFHREVSYSDERKRGSSQGDNVTLTCRWLLTQRPLTMNLISAYASKHFPFSKRSWREEDLMFTGNLKTK